MNQYKRETEVYFIDPNGNRIPDKKESNNEKLNIERTTHDNIAKECVFKVNPELEREFTESGIPSPSVFLVFKGYLLIIQDDVKKYFSIDYSSLNLNELTKSIVKRLRAFYKQEYNYTFELYDVIMNELSTETLESIRQLVKVRMREGKTREQMVDEIMKTIVVPVYLAQFNKSSKESVSRDDD